jgi:hypothetical protein
MEYAVISLIIAMFGIGAIDDSALQFGIESEVHAFMDNSLAAFNNRGMHLPDEKAKTYLKVNTKYVLYGLFEMEFGMQGWAAKSFGSSGSRGGGIWGFNVNVFGTRENPRMFNIGYRHFSCHPFIQSQGGEDCGNLDAIELKFTWGNIKYDSINNKIRSLF